MKDFIEHAGFTLFFIISVNGVFFRDLVPLEYHSAYGFTIGLICGIILSMVISGAESETESEVEE